MDARHEPSQSDRDAHAFLAAQGRRVLVSATKMDKLGKSQRFGAAQAAARSLGVAPAEVVPFSAVEGTGTDALWARIATLAKEKAPPAGEA